mmetsp:Transcript_4381/g.12580  ORF Transcript_4381/g.12580 Transcript_4381/m.12580 type:complete len:384 (-) Transcript_4381:1185-2336(-)|eukprot:CAMPEP_0172370554 /NCGR_PEP_ID=MMETSP1060-20121228/38164_1 /TAXON_ID=37318 /ORGANISM="Pseudo-nitzschia pungens, Strain cf. cingulata" /LENGTH=383 /DNA_ID=CAMNT_0013095849 /DNA_START=64 /DNA_END=1215 /DNA_ORIENTATION=+
MGERTEASNTNDNEASWESASNDRAFQEQASAAQSVTQPAGDPGLPSITSVRWDVEEDNSNNINSNNNLSLLTSETENLTDANGNATTSARRRAFASSFCSNCRSKCSLVYFLHVWDLVLTVLWTVFVGYHLVYNKSRENSRSTHMVLLLVVCSMLVVLNAARGLLWIWASLPSLSMICCCGCCDDDNKASRTLSKLTTAVTLWLGIMYGSISLVAWFAPSSWLPWCEELGPWCHKLIPIHIGLPIALTISSIIEFFRWAFFQGQMSSSSSASMQRMDYYDDDVVSSQSESSRHRPWWFNRRGLNSGNDTDDLHEPLVANGRRTHRQPSWAMTSWIPFRRVRNTNDTDHGVVNGDEEDVESVLDSLGEDWASRAESDPYWWTR